MWHVRAQRYTHIFLLFKHRLLLCLSWLYVCLRHGHHSLSFFLSLMWKLTFFTTLCGKQPCSLSSQKPRCSPSFTVLSTLFIPGSAFILLFTYMSLSHFNPPLGEPSWSPGNGDNTADCWGHFWTYICHGWESWIPHKGWCGFWRLCVQVCIFTTFFFFLSFFLRLLLDGIYSVEIQLETLM